MNFHDYMQKKFEEESLKPDEQVRLAKRAGPKGLSPSKFQDYLYDNGTLMELIARSYDGKDWASYIYTPRREWRFEALKAAIKTGVEGEEYWSLVGQVWQDGDYVGLQQAKWLRLFYSDVPPGRLSAMNDEERAVYDALPETVTLYRGASPKYRKGMSWSLKPKVAIFFAETYWRREKDARVYTVEVPRSQIMLYTEGRQEAEVIVDPRDLPEPKLWTRPEGS